MALRDWLKQKFGEEPLVVPEPKSKGFANYEVWPQRGYPQSMDLPHLPEGRPEPESKVSQFDKAYTGESPEQPDVRGASEWSPEEVSSDEPSLRADAGAIADLDKAQPSLAAAGWPEGMGPQQPQESQAPDTDWADYPQPQGLALSAEPRQEQNRQLAPATNAQAGTVDLDSLLKSIDGRQGPRNDARYYAALKGIATAFDPVLRRQSDTSFYDTAIQEEQQKQKDWQARLQAELKLKYARLQQQNAQNDALARAQLAQEGMNSRSEAQRALQEKLAAQRIEAAQSNLKAGQEFKESQFQRGMDNRNAQSDLNRDALLTATGYKAAGKAVENLPKASTLEQADRVEQLLDSGKPIPGFGKFINALRTLPPTDWGKGLGNAIANAGLTPEEQKQFNDVWSLSLQSIFDAGGKSLTASELNNSLAKLGEAAGQGPEQQAQAMRGLIKDIREKVKRTYSTLPPQAQKILKTQGIVNPKVLEQSGVIGDEDDEDLY